MPRIIPFIPSEAFYTFSTELDGTQYIFDVRWNARAETWFYDLKDAGGDIIRAGMALKVWSLSGLRSADSRAPSGVIVPIDTTEQNLDPTYDDIGVRVIVYYFSEDEIANL